jgi:hypothetical protein
LLESVVELRADVGRLNGSMTTLKKEGVTVSNWTELGTQVERMEAELSIRLDRMGDKLDKLDGVPSATKGVASAKTRDEALLLLGIEPDVLGGWRDD